MCCFYLDFIQISRQLSCTLTSLKVAVSSFSPPPHPGCGTSPPMGERRNIARVRNCPDVTILINLFGQHQSQGALGGHGGQGGQSGRGGRSD